MQFVKCKSHKTKEVALHIALKSEPLEFVQSFTLCAMDMMDFNLVNTFFETYITDVRHKPMYLVVCLDSMEMTLRLTKIPMT